MFKNKSITKSKLNSIRFDDNYLWGNILNDYIWRAKNNSFIKELLKLLIKICIIENYEIGEESNVSKGEVLMFYSAEKHRDDMKMLLTSVGNLIHNKDYLFIYNSKKLSFKNILQIFKLKLYYSKLRTEFKVLESIILSLAIIEKKIIEKKFFDNLNIENYKLLITFCDCFPEDNLLTQKLKSEGIKTATIQHGLYVYHNNDDSLLNHFYDNFISDYIFLWGNDTKEVFKKAKIDEDRLLVLGNPKYINLDKNKIYKDRLRKKDECIFGVVLNNPLGHEENKKLIRIANEICKKINYKYLIKPHPSINMDDYKNIIDNDYLKMILPQKLSILEYTEMVDFSLVGLSTVYLELNLFLSPVFRYIDLTYNYDTSKSLNKDYFTEIEEFIQIYNSFRNDKKSWISKMNQYSKIFFHDENIEKNYRMQIKNLIK